MARRDRAIQYHIECIGLFMDGRVKPGHDSGGRRQFFYTLFRGNDAAEVAEGVVERRGGNIGG